jgi:D-alanine-D-alanine ligase
MMRIGILFGGQAREREISFAGGKTAMVHINPYLYLLTVWVILF